MPSSLRSRIAAVVSMLLVIGTIVWFAWPSAVPVDMAAATLGPMEVTIDEEARTRVRKVYTISAPLSGVVLRPDLEAGDAVIANESIVAVIRPSAPSFHDPRFHQELQSALAAAEAAVSLAEAERRRVETALNLARIELTRLQSLTGQGAVPLSSLDKAKADVQIHEAALARARAAIAVRRNERTGAAARLKNPSDDVGSSGAGCCIQLRAPVSGQVLKLMEESEAVVTVGTPLLTIGDPTDLEVVAELLSTDAVKIKQGNSVRIDGWGGPAFEGLVRRLEPSGFLKVSALGIEEQRVRAVVDLVGAPKARQALGHDYRVIVHIVVWGADKVLTIPVGAVYRDNDSWAVFKDVGGRARTTSIDIGHRNARIVEVTSGLTSGDRIVVHASDRVQDGTRIQSRN